MEFRIAHCNINVTDLEKSISFYQEALQLEVIRKKETEDFTLCYLGDGKTPFTLELTWLKDHKHPYDLGENESHIAFVTNQFDQAYALHQKMGCVCFENKEMGIYFIHDPDDYWLEIIPAK